MEAKSLTILKRLAQLLRTRKEANSHPYHLFLSSSISLTPSLLRQVCDTDDWRTFCSYLATVSLRDRLSILSLAQQQHAPPLEDYLPLARLIVAGYFKTVLTTNTDSALEDALGKVLVEQGMSPYSFQTLIVSRDKDTDIAQALTERDTSIRIVKLYGSVRDEKLPDAFPEIFTLHTDLVESIRHYFNQDIVIVGPLTYDNAVNREIDRRSPSRIYYVPLRHPTKTDAVVQIIRARGNSPEDYLIAKYYDEYTRFFETLAEHTQQEKTGAPPYTTSGKLVALGNPGTMTPTSIPSSQLPDDASIPSVVRADILSVTVTEIETKTVVQVAQETRGHGPASTSSSQLPDDASIPSVLRADVLLVTVTEIETKAVLQVFQETYSHGYERHFIGKKTYYELGIINDARIFLVQSDMGISGTGGSLFTVHESIQALEPSSIIMVGIAFGVNPDKQRIGDILVSQQLCSYEHQRHGISGNGTPAVISRGDRVTASVKLLDRFKSGSLDWSERPYQGRRDLRGKRVQFGTLLSGEKLVDRVDFRDQLLALEPGAIGGEMEGAGLYAAAHNAKVDWILVKAICDWADGNKLGEKTVAGKNGTSRKISTKERDQKTAARNAAQFTVHVLYKTRLV